MDPLTIVAFLWQSVRATRRAQLHSCRCARGRAPRPVRPMRDVSAGPTLGERLAGGGEGALQGGAPRGVANVRVHRREELTEGRPVLGAPAVEPMEGEEGDQLQGAPRPREWTEDGSRRRRGG